MNTRIHIKRPALAGLVALAGVLSNVSASELIIDDRTSGTYRSNLGTEWQFVADQVMGGVSIGEMALDRYNNRDCLRLVGNVSTENNGGFIQMALPLSQKDELDATGYAGVELEIAGNNEVYNIHIRTAGLWFPWQSYRFSFPVTTDWQTLRLPFATIQPYKTNKSFQQDRLLRIGVVGIGRDFRTDLCVASVKFYKD